MGASHSYSPRNRDDCNMNPVIVHVDSDFETDDVVDIPEQIDSAHVATNTTETEKHSITTKPEKLGISYDDIEEIVSMYLGPKMVFDQSLNASCISQISRPSTTLMEAMTLEYDNYYDDCERRLYEVPRPKPPADHNQEPLRIAWQKGELLGSGAFGSVYLGLNTDEGKWFAAKQVSLAPNCEAQSTDANQFVQALVQEINVLKTLKQENIVQYLGTQRDNENLYIFLEFVPGGSIASIIKRFGKFKETLVSKYTRQILLGLEYLHRHQIMHRDIKGANILVDTNGVCKLADFGAAARLADITQAQRKTIQGTPFWMAPEVIKQTGHGRQADIWSVGCTVIEMVTGKPPWHQLKTPIAALFHIAAAVEPPELPPTLSPELRDFILLCMQRDPNKRPNATKLLQHPFLMNNENVTTNIESPGESILPADAAAIQDFLSQTATSQLKVIRSKSSKDDVPSSSAANNEPHDSVLSNHSCSRRQSL